MTVTMFAAGAAATALLIRKRTWKVPGEQGATAAVLMLGLGTYLISDECPVGRWLYLATGYGYLDTVLGHLLWIGATIALLHQTLYRLAERDERAQILDALVRWPVTLMVPLMLSAMLMSAVMQKHPDVDLGSVNAETGWLVAYRVVWYVTLVYLTCLLIRVLRIVRSTSSGPSRITNLYLAASWLVLAAVAVRMASYWDSLGHLAEVVEWLRCLAVVAVATAAAWSWLGKMWPHRGLLWHTRTSRRSLRLDTIDAHRMRTHAPPPPRCMFDDQPPEAAVS
ncbi:membrane protein [Mycobacterium phage Yuna]|uniref:Membrane protein n=1 Tax=Mycobacterium phage Yuna TaxID=2599885 RepID=A0A5J6TF59_9CAUD|nr:membrane protein [Mycobacterium phage Yuna]QFG09430.1 membrane protein [Mycobacterium phage Yuna]